MEDGRSRPAQQERELGVGVSPLMVCRSVGDRRRDRCGAGNVLRSKLSKDQWEECFEERSFRRGINKFLKMGGPIADTIRAYIRSVPASPSQAP